jgi:S-adenosylmethionine:tRNA-ribosyltransferase-isomerase (queuine synthetase)
LCVEGRADFLKGSEGQMPTEIHVNGISDADVAIINQLAASQGITRNKYLARLIHQHATNYYVEGELNDLVELVRQSNVVIKRNTEVIEALLDSLGIQRGEPNGKHE